jgi:hypothetical protein
MHRSGACCSRDPCLPCRDIGERRALAPLPCLPWPRSLPPPCPPPRGNRGPVHPAGPTLPPHSAPPPPSRHSRPAKSGYRVCVGERRRIGGRADGQGLRVGDERERGGAAVVVSVAVAEIVGRIESSSAAARCRCRGRTSAAWARTPGSSATSAATVRTQRLSSIASLHPPVAGMVTMNSRLTESCSFLHRDTQGYAEAGQGQGEQECMEGTHSNIVCSSLLVLRMACA